MFETSFKRFYKDFYNNKSYNYMAKKEILTAILIAFILNAIWEILHYRLYFDLSGIPKYPHLLLATFTDAAIIAGIFLLISMKNKNISWIKKPNKIDYLITIVLGILIAIAIESRALIIGRWAYRPTMPTISGIGLSPLLQLAVTGTLSLLIVRFISTQQH